MSTSLREEALCPVCMEILLDPISLSCVHIFCYNCLQLWLQQGKDQTLSCPICREVTKMPLLEELKFGTIASLVKQHDFLISQRPNTRGEFLKFREDMTLDAGTANSGLVLSDDLKKVRCGKTCHSPVENPQRFAYMACVLGTLCFSSGCHYWEVEVEEGKEWALGVCKESVDRKGKSSFSPEHGFWVISMKAGAIHSCSIPETVIPACSGLSRVGIFLDVEREEIMFFDVRNDAFIYIHGNLVSEPLRPFFCPGLPGEESGGPLSICC